MLAINYVGVVISSIRIIHKTCHTKDVKISCNQFCYIITFMFSTSHCRKKVFLFTDPIIINSIMMHFCIVVKIVKYATSYSRVHFCAWADEFSSTCFYCHLFYFVSFVFGYLPFFHYPQPKTRTHSYTLTFLNIVVSGSTFKNSYVMCICCR